METPHRITDETVAQHSTELFVEPTPKQPSKSIEDILVLLFGGDIKVKYTYTKIDKDE